MTNLLHETREAIEDSGHTPDDITFIGSEASGHSCTWAEFETLADEEYDSGFGGQEVATDLIIVFRDGQKMWRSEYDGSEWWSYSKPFIQPSETFPIERVIGSLWPSLADLHGDDDNYHRKGN